MYVLTLNFSKSKKKNVLPVFDITFHFKTKTIDVFNIYYIFIYQSM